jgi:PhnB protein
VAQPIPEGTPTIVPHLVVRGGAAAIEFYKRAFGATEERRMPGPDGTSVMHAELKIGTARLYLADEFPGMGRSPLGFKGTPVTIHLWSTDVDAAFSRAVGAGANVVMPLADMFWGDRYGQVRDPFGHLWALATHKEDPAPEEIMRRAAAAFAVPPPAPRKSRATKKRKKTGPKARAKRVAPGKAKARRVGRKRR